MWDTVDTTRTTLTHDMPCSECGHAAHTYLPCSDECPCVPQQRGGVRSGGWPEAA
jgi:hypothetical protein